MPNYKSHLTQVLLNCFDPKDVRVAQQPYTIDSQMLNLAACARESTNMRVSREINAANPMKVPLNIDNMGRYFMAALPPSLDLTNTVSASTILPVLHSVTGTLGSQTITLTPFDDTLPIPTGILVDTTRSSVPLSNAVMIRMTGSLDSYNNPLTQQSGPLVMPIPNNITFWLDNMGVNTGSIEILITGELYPRPVWTQQRSTYQESLVTTVSQGAFTSDLRWEVIDNITVRGMPNGATLTCWCFPFNLPACPDPDRPYVNHAYRDENIPRYWKIQGNLLSEVYIRGLDTGLEICNTYSTDLDLVDVVVEPNTYGLFAVTESSIIYIDRREPLPTNLTATAIQVQPVCGINAHLDTSKDPSQQRWVNLLPVLYTGAQILKYRWSVLDPNGTQYSITNSGAFTSFKVSFGWRSGYPTKHTFPLINTGTYTITLECQDITGAITKESVLYNNLALAPQVSLPVPFVPQVAGICFDSFDQAWIWTGSYAIPVMFTYDSYILDIANQAIYVTKNYDSIEVTN